jgi:hypothetical protein
MTVSFDENGKIHETYKYKFAYGFRECVDENQRGLPTAEIKIKMI